MRTLMGVMTAAAAILGCAPKPPAVTTVIEDKVYTVSPASVTVTAGIVNGEVTELKVMERTELAYIPSSYKLQTAAFPVSIGGQ